MELTALHCPSCGLPIPGEEVHLELSLARCKPCGAVFDLASRTQARGSRPSARAPAPLPPKFQVEDRRGDGLTVRWRWFRPASIFLAFFSVFWMGFLVVWYGIALSAEETPIVALLFPLLHVAAGVGISYFTLASFLNTTEVTATRSKLTVRHGPIPWRGNVELDGRELTQLFGLEHRHQNKGSVSYTWSLNAVDRRGTKRKLLSGLDEIGQVLWLEQALERQLHLEDAPVDGEVARRSAQATAG